jgi:hypothetical protein
MEVVMKKKMSIVGLVGALLLLSYAADAAGQNRARADIKNAQGKVLNGFLVRPRTGVLIFAKDFPRTPCGPYPFGGEVKALPTSAGGHFNPLGKHGLRTPGPHAGDCLICMSTKTESDVVKHCGKYDPRAWRDIYL